MRFGFIQTVWRDACLCLHAARQSTHVVGDEALEKLLQRGQLDENWKHVEDYDDYDGCEKSPEEKG